MADPPSGSRCNMGGDIQREGGSIQISLRGRFPDSACLQNIDLVIENHS